MVLRGNLMRILVVLRLWIKKHYIFNYLFNYGRCTEQTKLYCNNAYFQKHDKCCLTNAAKMKQNNIG